MSKNPQYIKSEITKSAIDKSWLAYSNRIRRNLRFFYKRGWFIVEDGRFPSQGLCSLSKKNKI